MSTLNIWALIAAACGWLNAAGAQLEIVSNGAPESVFCGSQNQISIIFHNGGSESFDGEIRMRVFQATSDTAVSMGEAAWKKLEVLPQQTVLESAQLNFPPVNAETLFLIQWISDSNRVVGTTSVLVYPTNLFQALRPFLDRKNFGVFDPGNQLKPLLKRQGISFADLGEMKLDDFRGRLAIIGPFQSQEEVPKGLANRIKTIARKNVAVVWIQPPQAVSLASPLNWERKRIEPTYYWVRKRQTAIVIVRPDMASDLPKNPQSQVTLIYLCRFALDPEQMALPILPQAFNDFDDETI
ncbi:MAG TPA: hypothetical protein VMF08_03435 [Candidatus Sulfotelmatobacter sp.]|nr:hypothetical protein [Candidatus Sulfotelmatobacter sp.]